MSDSRYRRRCRGATCRAEIGLIPTQGGSVIPLDVAPSPKGNVRIDRDLFGEPVAVVLGTVEAEEVRASGEKLYMPHHATCPDVEEFRRA